MDGARLSLTTKGLTQGPNPTQTPVGALEFAMRYLGQINQVSQYRFMFDLDNGTVIHFNLAGVDCVNFFSLMDTILTPNQPNPHAATLTTVDGQGANNGTLDVALARVYQFANGTSLFSYDLTLSGNPILSFKLTSTDAGGVFSVFDAILWSNPPNPPIY